MHGNTRNAIARRYRNGYKPSAICDEWGIDLTTLAVVLIRVGVFRRFKYAIGTLRNLDR